MKGPQETTSEPGKRDSVLSQINSFFTSVRTTITLLFLLSAASIVGTIVPQTSSPEQLSGYSSGVYFRIAVILDLYNVYRSWWFVLLLILLSLNLLGCLMRRLPAIPAEWRSGFSKSNFSFAVSHPGDVQETKNRVLSTMNRLMGASARETRENGFAVISWTKHRVYLLGFPFLHTAIIIILLGGLVGLVYGTRGHVLIQEGDAVSAFESSYGQVRSLPFQIAVDKFTLSHYPSGEPKEFRSDVRLLENGKEAVAGSIRVNHPLTFKGISMYQSDYRVTGLREVKLEAQDASGKKSEFILRPKGKMSIPGASYEIELLSLDPGATGRGAGVKIGVTGPGENRTVYLHRKDSGPVQIGDVKLRFLDYTPLYATGLQIGYDPGAILVWIGCGFLIVGFSLILFTNHRQVSVKIRPEKTGSRIEVSGRSKRLRREFREQVEAGLGAQLRENLRRNPGTGNTKNVDD